MSLYQTNRQQLRSDRKYVRVDTEFPTQIGLSGDDDLITAQVIDISRGGMRLCCGHALILHILPDYPRTVGLIMDVEVDVQFRMPSSGQRGAPIKVRARVIHTERLAQDNYHVGIEFLNLNQAAGNKLDAYIKAAS